MESPKPARTRSIGAWSGFAGANQSQVVDLMISNVFSVCAVVGAVVMFAAADSPLFWLGAALGLASVIILGSVVTSAEGGTCWRPIRRHG